MLLLELPPAALTALLSDNADEPWARVLGEALAGRRLTTTLELAAAVRAALPRLSREEQEASIRRVFQALRITVNDELSALDNLLRQLPDCLNPGGRAAILSFHSGEDRRVKSAFAAGLRTGWYEEIAPAAMRPTPAESRDNPRSAPARLRWARRTSTSSSSSNR